MTAPAQAPERGLVSSAVDPEISAAMQVYDRLSPLRNALGIGDLTDGEMQLFAMVAHRTGLDPFARQIYAIKRAGKVTHQTGIDGYRSSAERTREYLGSDEATYEACDCGKPPKDHPAVARVIVHRAHPSGHVVDQVGVARWHELVPPSGQDSMWQKMPFNQLAKCAEANGLRKAFPRVLGGVYITEELEQAGPAESAPLVEAAAKPTARERISARRAAIGTVIEHAPAEDEAEASEASTKPLWAAAGEKAPEDATELVTAPQAGSLVERLRTNAQASSLVGVVTEPQKAKLGAVIGRPSGLDWAGEVLPVLVEAFGEGFVADEMTAAQAQSVIGLAESDGQEAFVAAWRASVPVDVGDGG